MYHVLLALHVQLDAASVVQQHVKIVVDQLEVAHVVLNVVYLVNHVVAGDHAVSTLDLVDVVKHVACQKVCVVVVRNAAYQDNPANAVLLVQKRMELANVVKIVVNLDAKGQIVAQIPANSVVKVAVVLGGLQH